MARISSSRDYFDYKLEHALLYQLLFHPKRMEIIKEVYPALFFSKDTQENLRLFKSIKDLGENASLPAVAEDLHSKYGTVPTATYQVFESREIEYMAKETMPDSLIGTLKRLLYRRLSLDKLQRMIDLVESGERNGKLTLETNKLLLLERKLLAKDKNTTDKLARETADRINTQSNVVPTCFDFINDRLAGLTRKSISSLLAMPKNLKSTFTDALISGTVKATKLRGLIISLEDPAEERVKRVIANELDISLADMRFGRVKVNQQDIYTVLAHTMGGRLYFVDVRDVLTADDAMRVINDIKPDIVAVDHIQKFVMDDMVVGIIKAVKTLEIAANMNNCHIFITSQVKDKSVDYRDDRMPTASDAQWTSALRQSSTEMFSQYWNYQYTKNKFEMHLLDFEITAARYADAIGRMKLHIDADKGRIIGEFK